MTPAKLYIWITGTAFAILTAVMLLLPRSTYSELEKRDLAEVPEFTLERLSDSRYTKDLSAWFSDTEPFRDRFMSANMKIRDMIRFSFFEGDEAVSFKKTDSQGQDGPPENATAEELREYENRLNADANAKIEGSGIIVVGKGANVRALMAFGGSASGGLEFAGAVSRYQKEMPSTKVYAMVIPLASEFYTPDKAKDVTRPQLPFIRNVYDNLRNGAIGVNAYNALSEHVSEDIYLRTDHHWAPLGAYYAADAFTKAAKVPFKPLSAYDKKVVRRFVGSMYGYSKDEAVKNAPEDFVYYQPKGLSYTTTYRNYSVNKDYQVTSESKPASGPFFYAFKDGSGGAYSTFMGGDQRLTKVVTGTKSARRVLIIKDSYGNALPGYLFYSFGEVHVVDFRYFPHNIKKYVKDNNITDIVFCVNVFNAYSSNVAKKLTNMLSQGEGTFHAPTKEEKKEEPEKHHGEAKPAEHHQPESEQGGHVEEREQASPEPEKAPEVPQSEPEGD